MHLFDDDTSILTGLEASVKTLVVTFSGEIFFNDWEGSEKTLSHMKYFWKTNIYNIMLKYIEIGANFICLSYLRQFYKIHLCLYNIIIKG